jgi:hypothetical protein
MKNFFFTIAVAALCLCTMSFNSQFNICAHATYESQFCPSDSTKNPINSARVESQSGILLFIRCKPANKYDVIATISPKVLLSDDPDDVIEYMVNQVNKKYTGANALLFLADDLGSAQAIHIKQ